TSLAYLCIAAVNAALPPSALEKISPPASTYARSFPISTGVHFGSTAPLINRAGASCHSSGLTCRFTTCQLIGFSKRLLIHRVTYASSRGRAFHGPLYCSLLNTTGFRPRARNNNAYEVLMSGPQPPPHDPSAPWCRT